MIRPIGIAGPTYTERSSSIATQRTVNLYPHVVKNEDNRVSQLALYATPGFTQFVDLGTAARIRGLLVRSNGNLIAVSGTGVYSVTSGGVATLMTNAIGLDSNSPVHMYENFAGQIIIIVRGTGLGYILSGTTVTQIADADFPSCLQSEFLDQYFFALASTNQRVYYSALNNGTSWDPLDFFVVETSTDAPRALIVSNKELYVFGSIQGNIYYDSGNANNPFIPRSGGIIQYGIAANDSLIDSGDDIFLLGQNKDGFKVILKIQGYEESIISDAGLNATLNGYSTVSDCIAFTQDFLGHRFLWFYFPTANATHVYDITTEMWHERSGAFTTTPIAHRAACATSFAGFNIIGDHTNGKLYKMATAYTTDNGTAIRRLRRAPYIGRPSQRSDFTYFNDFKMKYACVAAVDNPKWTLSMSDDGGTTFSKEIGLQNYKISNEASKLRWATVRRLGRAEQRSFQVVTDDPVESISDAYVDIS